MTEKGNYVFAILKTNKDYDHLRDRLLNLRNEMSSIQSIDVNNQIHNVEYFFGGDFKFLACVRGLGLQTKTLLVCGVNA